LSRYEGLFAKLKGSSKDKAVNVVADFSKKQLLFSLQK